MTVDQIKDAVCKVLSEKKAADITVLNVHNQTTLADYFVIATGRSTAQVKSLSENLEEKLELDFGISPTRTEGQREGRWVVLDYGGVIVHIFNDETRMLYNLERLWTNGANVEKISDDY